MSAGAEQCLMRWWRYRQTGHGSWRRHQPASVKTKRDAAGIITRHNAQLMAKDTSSSRESILMKSSHRWRSSSLCNSYWLTQRVRDG
jgi:hypothetical protein